MVMMSIIMTIATIIAMTTIIMTMTMTMLIIAMIMQRTAATKRDVNITAGRKMSLIPSLSGQSGYLILKS